MSNTTDTPKATITVEGNQYVIENLPTEIQSLISLYQTWAHEQTDAQNSVIKLRYAIERVTEEIKTRIVSLADSEDKTGPEEGDDAEADPEPKGSKVKTLPVAVKN